MFLKKILILLCFAFILAGCATYKFQKSQDKSEGYLVSYDDKPIIEYTVGPDKSLPGLETAKERFNRRRASVEYYYKKMGLIESKWKQNFWNFPAMLVDFVGGVLRWPFTAISDYRYNHNPAYKERTDKLEEEKEELEKANLNNLKEKLKNYIDNDLAKESGQEKPAEAPVIKTEPPVLPAEEPKEAQITQEAAGENPPVTSEAIEKTVPSAPVEIPAQPAVKVEKILPIQIQPEQPVAVISAKPLKGYSPLKVKFSAQQSHVQSGKIVSYHWDFGDGDSSTQKNPENTYWSTNYGQRKFIATLTVTDDRGSSSSASAEIEVSTR